MASSFAPWWKRHVLFRIPGLYKRCPEGNFHPRWDRLCFCRCSEHCGDWHGGILDFKTGRELIPYQDVEKFWLGVGAHDLETRLMKVLAKLWVDRVGRKQDVQDLLGEVLSRTLGISNESARDKIDRVYLGS